MPRDAESPAAEAVASAVARVEVHFEAAPVLDAWAELEESAPCSIYQTRAWLLPWTASLAQREGLAPAFVLARDGDGRPVALLGLGIARRGPLRIARWLGGRDSNANMALLARGGPWTPAEIRRLLRLACRSLGREAPDLFALTNQPASWDGIANPLLALPSQASPSPAFGTALPADAEALFAAKLSKDTRKKLRKKEARLAALGPLRHVVAQGRDEQVRIVEAFLALRNARFRAQNIPSPFEAPEMRDFILAASATPQAGIELHALEMGERVVAVYGGAAHQGQWSGMFNAFDSDEAIAPSSPGDLLLLRVVADARRRGCTRFDLGIGAARYKASLCDEEIALFDTFVPMSVAGHAVAAAIAGRQGLKRIVKSDPRLFALAKRLRGRRA